jgi:hypothetical protein
MELKENIDSTLDDDVDVFRASFKLASQSDEDWSGRGDRGERRKLQNRLNQRASSKYTTKR